MDVLSSHWFGNAGYGSVPQPRDFATEEVLFYCSGYCPKYVAINPLSNIINRKVYVLRIYYCVLPKMVSLEAKALHSETSQLCGWPPRIGSVGETPLTGSCALCGGLFRCSCRLTSSSAVFRSPGMFLTQPIKKPGHAGQDVGFEFFGREWAKCTELVALACGNCSNRWKH